MEQVKKFASEVAAWPHVSVHSHRFRGREFRFASAEIGHVHTGGTVDIPFPKAIRNVLLQQGLADEHRWLPNSGWISFHIRDDKDLVHALWLMRLSYVRYAMKASSDPRAFLEQESNTLHLNPELKCLLRTLVPPRTPSQPRLQQEAHERL